MKQKVVIKLQMDCDKCRNKALKTAADVKGVTAVSIEGDDKDRVVVIGDDVDTICLANQLRKKFRSIVVLSVEKHKTEEEKKKDEEKKKEDEKKKEEEWRKKYFGSAALCLPPLPPSNPCPKCHTLDCKGKCVLICFKCHSPKCEGKCDHHDPCSNCKTPKCDGNCKPPPQPCFNPCPPWCSCPRCYIPYYPPNYRVVYNYDTCPDSTCSIM